MKGQRDRFDDYSEQQMMAELEQDYWDSIDDEDMPFSRYIFPVTDWLELILSNH